MSDHRHYGLLAGLILALGLTALAGENPFHVLYVLLNSSFGSRYDFGMTLSYTTPLIFTGLSVALAFHAGLFNIGGEGQLAFGAMAAALTGIFLTAIPFPLAPVIAALAAFLAGGLWGAFPGWLKIRFGSHEVINTIMLNFVAAGLVSWLTLDIVYDPQSQVPVTRHVGDGFLLRSIDPIARLFPDTPVSLAAAVAVLCAVGLWAVLWRTSLGFSIRAVGYNEEAARVAGIPVGRIRILCMFAAGGLAGMVGIGEVLTKVDSISQDIGEVLGANGNFRLGFSPDYGFLGIGVALLARNSPIGVIFSALLFGSLHRGSAALDLETEKITRDFSYILQAVIILFVSVRTFPAFFKNRRRRS